MINHGIGVVFPWENPMVLPRHVGAVGHGIGLRVDPGGRMRGHVDPEGWGCAGDVPQGMWILKDRTYGIPLIINYISSTTISFIIAGSSH